MERGWWTCRRLWPNLSRLVQTHCGGICTTHILDTNHRELELV
jgi:hypothetical protein